nr:immunoglobulin heavy chain junction region [Macaca mulatta]
CTKGSGWDSLYVW